MSGRLIPVLNAAIFVLAVALALFAVYVAGYGSFKPSLFRGGVVLYSILLAALVLLRTALGRGQPAVHRSGSSSFPFLDW